MADRIGLLAAQPIVEPDSTMSQPFRTWALTISDLQPFVGTGSPEGNLEAPQFSLYLDSTGTTGTIEYRKMIPSIAGDRKQGWVLL